MRLKPFLDKYHTVIFDMDGVITQEVAYWDAAALTVYQQINARKFFSDDSVDVEKYLTSIPEIRKEVFCNDKTIGVLKNKGVNSNWDLAYVVLGIALSRGDKDFSKVLEYAENMSDDIFAEYEKIAGFYTEKLGISDASRTSRLWEELKMRFQEWVLGDEVFYELYGYPVTQSGKRSLLESEVPVVDGEKLKTVIELLKGSGKKLGIATGRIRAEAEPALKKFGIIESFDEEKFINFDYVASVQERLGVQVTKPHPYMFEKAYLGKDFPDEKILSKDYDKTGISGVLVVGDAGADILGAKAMGADFCAVLTGVNGNKTKPYFEKVGAEYILESILEFIQ